MVDVLASLKTRSLSLAGIKLFSLSGTFLDIESRFEQVEIKQTEDQQWKLASIVENGMKNFAQYLFDANRVNGTNNGKEKKRYN